MAKEKTVLNSNEYFSLHYTSYVVGDDTNVLEARKYGTSKWKGPRRVCIFCSLAIVLPSLLISIPLLMRFVIYGSSSYVIHPSDTRVLDQRISTTWCQAETIKANATFSAYVTNGEPSIYGTPTTVSFDRSMEIPDDHKKYWGLYLLPGSTFRVRVCARHKGGTVLIVRGNKHMKYCAYEGEADSAGNSDQVSGSTSVEYTINSNGKLVGPGNKLLSTKELGNKGQDDLTILSRLKNFLQTHPKSRDKLQRTLEDWMLLNSTGAILNGIEVGSIEETTAKSPSEPLAEGVVEQGTILRKRREIDVRKDTESGENGAFEDESEISDIDPILPHKNISTTTTNDSLTSTPPSIWKQEHNRHSGIFNISVSPEDGSNSESESSFSSSEEALLKCEGIIASFKIPYEPNTCLNDGAFSDLNLTKVIPGLDSNILEFHVEQRDYYYFIFGSENERETNWIRANFELEKVEYLLPEPLENCTDVNECQISFTFASSEKVVIKLPVPPNPNRTSTPSMEYFIAETECKPRTHLYLIFVILVPVVILMFAFK